MSKSSDNQKSEEIVIDATNLIVGRLATHVAKQALEGNTIKVINCEKAVKTGKRKSILNKAARNRSERGQVKKGPYIHRPSDRFVRRIIRGMLPHKKMRGREALSRIKCYIGVPPELEGSKAESLEDAHIKRLNNLNYITIGEICKHLGAKA